MIEMVTNRTTSYFRADMKKVKELFCPVLKKTMHEHINGYIASFRCCLWDVQLFRGKLKQKHL